MNKFATIMVSLFALKCSLTIGSPAINVEYLEEYNQKKLMKYRNLAESLMSTQKDLLSFCQNIGSMIPKKLPLKDKRKIRSFYEEIKQGGVIEEQVQLAKILDIYLTHRLRASFSLKNFLIALEDLSFDPEYIYLKKQTSAPGVMWGLSIEQLLNYIGRAQYVLSNMIYPTLHIDIGLDHFIEKYSQLSVNLAVKFIEDLDNNTCSLSPAGHKFFVDKFYLESGYLQTFSLLKQIQDLSMKSQVCILNLQKSKLSNAFPGATAKDKAMLISLFEGKSLRKPTPSPIQIGPQTEIPTENLSASNVSEALSTQVVACPPVIAVAEADGEAQQESLPAQQDNVDDGYSDFIFNEAENRPWLGYNFEKKLMASRAKQQRKVKRGNNKESDLLPSDTQQEVFTMDGIKEDVLIQNILNYYRAQNITRYNILEDILVPQKVRIKSLEWEREVIPLLNDVSAIVKKNVEGSRVRVTINGLSSVFHAHRTIGADTIYTHLRGFLLQALSRGIDHRL